MRIVKTEAKPKRRFAAAEFSRGLFVSAMSDYAIRSSLILLSVLSLFGLQYSVFSFYRFFAKDVLHSGGAGIWAAAEARRGVGAVLGALQFAAAHELQGSGAMDCGDGPTILRGVLDRVFRNRMCFGFRRRVLFVVGFAATSQMAATNTTIQNRVSG